MIDTLTTSETTLPEGWRDALTIQEIMAGETGDCVLLHSFPQECDRIRRDAQERANALNRLLSYGITLDMLRHLASKGEVDTYIEAKLREENPEYARLTSLGISVTAQPSGDLRMTREYLIHWQNIRGHAGSLTFTGGKWMVDDEAIEADLVRHDYKRYLAQERLPDLRELVKLCNSLMAIKQPMHQLAGVPHIAQRINWERDKCYPKWQYFM